MMYLSSEFVRVLAILFLCGLVYDLAVVDRIERRQPPLGVTAFEVAAGVLFTMVGFGILVGMDKMLIALMCFAASGLPMIYGSLRRAQVI